MAEQVCKNCGKTKARHSRSVIDAGQLAYFCELSEYRVFRPAEPSPEPAAPPEKHSYRAPERLRILGCGECGRAESDSIHVAEPQQASAEPRDKWSDYLHALTLSYPQNPTAIAVAKEVRSMHVAQLAALKQSLGQCVEALKRFSRPDDCGDHCGNSCPQCQASKALAAAAELTEAR